MTGRMALYTETSHLLPPSHPPETQWERKEKIPSQRGELGVLVFTTPDRVGHVCNMEKRGGFFQLLLSSWKAATLPLEPEKEQVRSSHAGITLTGIFLQTLLLQAVPGRGHKAGLLNHMGNE